MASNEIITHVLPLQYGFKRRRSTGTVDRENVYGPGGRYFFGVDFDFKVFPADNHQLNFKQVTVFTKDRLEVKVYLPFS